ncbi:MAG TPA: hypothetical protein QF611_06880 [Pseudomonadales bacterium]|nr:hypothetical protein [Pseudomonadales bacterium]MDP6315618.1 hypothetical protein [Pseudomonadales bacterium]HJP50734.1 hypothetical protein [Pseudomonadales bacterium]
MLRASCEANQIQLDVSVVIDPTQSCGVTHYRELLTFTDNLLVGDSEALNGAREQLRAVVGDEGVIRAAGAVGTFQMMNRALDTLGAQLGKELNPELRLLADKLNMTPPAHWV